MQPPVARSLMDRVAVRRDFLAAYQDAALAERYAALVSSIRSAERRVKPGSTALAEAVAESYFKLLAVKDEYEVARLFTSATSATWYRFRSQAGAPIRARLHVQVSLRAAMCSLVATVDSRAKKIAFGPWMLAATCACSRGCGGCAGVGSIRSATARSGAWSAIC